MSICEKVNLSREFRIQRIPQIPENHAPFSKDPTSGEGSEISPSSVGLHCAGGGVPHIFTHYTHNTHKYVHARHSVLLPDVANSHPGGTKAARDLIPLHSQATSLATLCIKHNTSFIQQSQRHLSHSSPRHLCQTAGRREGGKATKK